MRDRESITKDLKTLWLRFKRFDEEWGYLKSQSEFWADAGKNFALGKLYEEGRSCCHYLAGSLETQYLDAHKILVDEYVSGVATCIPDDNSYWEVFRAAEKIAAESYSDNYTVKYMLRQYQDQWGEVARVKQFINELKKTVDYRPVDLSTPMEVIRGNVKKWEQNSQIFIGVSETNLRSQLVLALRNAGFHATAESHVYLGHSDVLVSQPPEAPDSGNLLVSECKFWGGSVGLYDTLSQLCKYITPHDKHVSAIVFVTEGDFADVCRKAFDTLLTHPCYAGGASGVEFVQFNLKPPQNQSLTISASLLLCNFTVKRYVRTRVVDSFNDYLRAAFSHGGCICIRCKQSGGDQTNYGSLHTYEFSGEKYSRRFAITATSDVVPMLKKVWLSVKKTDLSFFGEFPKEDFFDFVEANLHDQLMALLLGSAVVVEKDGAFVFVPGVASVDKSHKL